MRQIINSGNDSINNQAEIINNYYENKKYFDLSDSNSRQKFFMNCIAEIIKKEHIEIISINQLKTKLALEIFHNCANSEYNYSMEELLPSFNAFIESSIFSKEEGYKLSFGV